VIEVPSIARDRAGHPRGSPSRRAAPAGRPAQLPRVFTGVRRHRLDLSSRRFRGTNRGRARPCDFCRWMSPRARPRTTRTSRSTQCAVATAARARPVVAFPVEAAAGAPRGQGPGQTDARHSRRRLLAPETSPQPRSFQAPRVARRHLSPVWSDAVRWWRCQRRLPLQGAPDGRVAWHQASAKRPGVDQPEVPSITRRSRANGHVPGSRSCQSAPAPFSPPASGAGDARVASGGSTARREGGEPSSFDPPQRPRVTSAFE
jgi:hypothetical protein